MPEDGEFDENAHLSFNDVSVDCLDCPRVVLVRIKESRQTD